MVEISKFYDVDIYTIAGQYVGRVADVVLNIKYGTISKLIVKASVPERRSAGFIEILTGGFKLNSEEEGVPNYQESLVEVSYDKVKAIGDIMLIDPQGLFKRPQERPQIQNGAEEPTQPNVNKPIPNQEPVVENPTNVPPSTPTIDDVAQPVQNPEIRKVE